MVRILRVLTTVLVLAAADAGASYATFTYGETPLAVSPDGNPALFRTAPFFMTGRVALRIAGRTILFNERVMSFDNPVSLGNSYQFADLDSVGVFIRPRPLLSAGLSLDSWRNFDYKAAYRFPAGAAVFDGTRSLDSAGTVRVLQLSAVCHIREVFAFGATAGYLFGGQKISSSAEYVVSTNLDWISTETFSYSGWRLAIDASCDLAGTLRITADACLPVRLRKERSGGTYDLIDYPATLGLSAAVRKLKPTPVELYAGVEYGFYSAFQVLTGDPGDMLGSSPYAAHDTLALLCGVRLSPASGKTEIPFRLGYAWRPDFINKMADRHTVFAGCEAPLGHDFALRFSAELTKRNWRGDNVFYESDKLVDETSFAFALGLSWRR